uniref:Mobile element protein n=1 Tax=Klebsiella pneumoniae TaxID=573 RepID=A0A6G9HTY3_KLEPN|nr:Mobile element protein [Klebsiella pneumoniae]
MVRALMIDSTGLKVFGEGEWKVRKHGKERRRIWRKLHLAVSSIRTFMKKTEPACASLTPSPMPFIIFSAW